MDHPLPRPSGDGTAAPACTEVLACAAVQPLVGWDRAVITVASTTDDARPLRGSDLCLRELDDLQRSVLDGPAVDSWRTGATVLVDDLRAGHGRWPLLEAADFGCTPVVSLAVVPLRATSTLSRTDLADGSEVTAAGAPGLIGALVVARDEMRPFTVGDTAVLERTAALVSALLSQRHGGRTVPGAGARCLSGDQEHDWLSDALESGSELLALASGVIMARLDLDAAAARTHLRAQAFVRGRTMRDLAREVLDPAGLEWRH